MSNEKPSCDLCATEEVKILKEFPPSSEEPEHTPIFCKSCFMKDEVEGDEPTTLEEKEQMFEAARFVGQTFP